MVRFDRTDSYSYSLVASSLASFIGQPEREETQRFDKEHNRVAVATRLSNKRQVVIVARNIVGIGASVSCHAHAG